MSFFDEVKKNLKDNRLKKDAEQKAEAEALQKKRVSAAKKQTLVNNLILAKTPTGGR